MYVFRQIAVHITDLGLDLQVGFPLNHVKHALLQCFFVFLDGVLLPDVVLTSLVLLFVLCYTLLEQGNQHRVVRFLEEL